MARHLEPLSLVIGTTCVLQFLLERRYDDAIKGFVKVVALDHNFGMAHFFLGQAYGGKGTFNRAIRELEASAELKGRSLESLAILGWTYARGGSPGRQPSGSRISASGLTQSTFFQVLFAQLVLGLGENRQALDYLDQARRVRAADLDLAQRPASLR